MTTGVPLYLVSACNSSEEFVAAFRRYADRTGLFVPIAAPLPQGKKGRIALTLKDGGVMVEGEAEIVQSSQKSPLHGRAGIVVKFTEPDEPSRTVLAELEKARLAMKPAPPSVPPRPAEVPAEPRAVPPAVGGRIDAANALAECVVIGDAGALRDVENGPPKAGQKFVVPAIPAMGARPKTPTGVPEIKPPTGAPAGRAKTPTGVPEIKPPTGVPAGRAKTPTGVPEVKPADTRLTTMGMPAMRPPGPGSGPIAAPTAKKDPTPPPAAAAKKDPTPIPKKDPTPPPAARNDPPPAVGAAATKRDLTPPPFAATKKDPTPKQTPTSIGVPPVSLTTQPGVAPRRAVDDSTDDAWTDDDLPTTQQAGVVPVAALSAEMKVPPTAAKAPMTTQPGVVAGAKADSGPVKGPTTAPGMVAAPAPKTDSAKTAVPSDQKPAKSAKMTQLGIPVVKLPADAGSRPEPPKATTLGMVPLRATSPVHQTQPVAVVAAPKDAAAVITNKPPRDEPPEVAKKPPLPAPTPTRSKSGTTPPRHPTPAVPLPVARVPAKSAPLIDPADEKTDLSEVPVPQTDFGFPNVEAERTERPAPPPEPELRPQRSGGMRASEIMAAVQVDDWTMTPDASAPTVIPSAKPEAKADPKPEVQEPTPAPKGPPTGNWTISLDPSTETGWSEPAKIEPPPTPPADKPTKIEKRTPVSAQTPSTGNPVHAVASDKAIEAVQWEDKPTSIGEKIEIDPTLMEPLEPLPALDDRSSGSMPAYPAAGSNGSMTDFAAASSPELPPPLAPPPSVPPPFGPNPTGSQQAYAPQDMPIGFAPTLLPGQMQAPPGGGFAYPTAPPVYQQFPSEASPAVKRSNKRVIVIAASAAAVVILAVVLALTLGGKHGKRAAAGKGSGGSAAVVVPPPPPVTIDAAVAQVAPGSDQGSDEGSATRQVVTPPTPETCTVAVTTSPAGAVVTLEDKTVLGSTPDTFTLPCGTPTKLVIKKAKYVTATRTVTPAPDGTKLAVTLGVGTFLVKVTSSPAGAMITVGGRPKGVTPTAIQLPAHTTQTITLTKDGYATDTERISVKANGISHHVTLKRGGRRR